MSWNRGQRFLERHDDVLGTVRLCTKCQEEWPVDGEFFYFDREGKVLGHCKACWADRNREQHAARRAS